MSHHKQSGFSYLIVLVGALLIGIMAQVTYQKTSYLHQRDNEAELLFRGLAYYNAIKAYYYANPAHKRYPRTLQDLLEDPRQPGRRFLRQLYAEPMEQGTDWIALHAADGGIAGVASPAETKPLKQSNFPPALAHFTGTARYRDWEFVFYPTSQSGATRK